jgi:hypothetical protein
VSFVDGAEPAAAVAAPGVRVDGVVASLESILRNRFARNLRMSWLNLSLCNLDFRCIALKYLKIQDYYCHNTRLNLYFGWKCVHM